MWSIFLAFSLLSLHTLVWGADSCGPKCTECDSCNNVFEEGPFDSDLPLIVVTTPTEVQPSTGDKIVGHMSIIDHRPSSRNSVTQTANVYDGIITIRRRGQSSDIIYCKKQYSVKLRGPNDTDREEELLGLPSDDKWIIQGPYSDKSLQRQALMMNMSNAIDLYGPRYVFVEMFLVDDGSASIDYKKHYLGVYTLLEKITRGKNRVDVAKMDDTKVGSELSGGYIVKRDKPKDGNSVFQTSTANMIVTMVYPDEDKVTDEQKKWIGGYISCFEESLFGSSFNDPSNGYKKFIDVDSFINYFLLSELSNNADSYKFSTYMNKDRYGLLRMGPLWDYDIAFGNVANWIDVYASCQPTNPQPACEQRFKYQVNAEAKIPDISSYYARLLKDPEFKSAVLARWQALRSAELSDASLEALVSYHAGVVAEGQVRNFQKWKDPGLSGFIWPENNMPPFLGCEPTFEAHTQGLLTYALGRARWMDTALAGNMYTIDQPPVALPCCHDPTFSTCTGPQGQECPVTQDNVNGHLGQFFDTANCAPGTTNSAGCLGVYAGGACRWCLAPGWQPGDPGSGDWAPCIACPIETPCFPFSNSPGPTVAPVPTFAPSEGPPTSTAPTLVTPAPTPQENPTAPTAASPTPSTTQFPSMLPTPTRGPNEPIVSPTPSSDKSESQGGSSTGVVVAVIGSVALLLVVFMCVRRAKLRASASKHKIMDLESDNMDMSGYTKMTI